ncbi:MAG TPA: IS5 family transposase [Acidocella sp.]|nr:IS5 family transposase [Acidocella sp.]
MSFTDAELTLKKKQTRRERFLAQLDELIPWADLLAVIEPHYPRSGSRGRQPIGLEVMLRIHLVQLAYNYSDPAMEDALVEIPLLRQFCRLGMDEIPDETTILNFRHMLEAQHLASPVFERINANLAARGLFLKQGTIVDASLIAAPSSTRNAEGKRDKAMHQSKKGNQYYFGAELHVGADSETGLVRLDLTAGNVADITHAHHLLRDEDEAVMGDAGYTGLEKRPEMADKNLTCLIALRPGKLAKLTALGGPEANLLKAVSHELASRRAKVEHVFRDIKVWFGYAKVRYRGLAKNLSRITMLAGMANLFRARSYERRHGMIVS